MTTASNNLDKLQARGLDKFYTCLDQMLPVLIRNSELLTAYKSYQ